MRRRDTGSAEPAGCEEFPTGEHLPRSFQNAQAGQFVASRYGERVGLYCTLASFDRYLKGAATPFVGGDETAQATDARGRLVAILFDDSSDRSSIGQGLFDLTTRKNKPYMIENERVPDHLSFYFRSFYAFDGPACEDIRLGC